MAYQAGKQGTQRSKPSYAYAIVSVTMVLFLLGLMGSLILYSGSISRWLKEQIAVNIELKETAKEVDVLQLQKKLDKEAFVQSSKFISKEEGLEKLMQELKIDPTLMPSNPLFDMIELRLHADYINKEFLEEFSATTEKDPLVADVYYIDQANEIDNKLKLVGYIVAGFGLLILIISLSLIDNTIKLAMYSNRFLIKSMQLVGATRWFIIKPFIMRGLFNGFVSGVIAVLGLVGLLFWLMSYNPTLLPASALLPFAGVFAGVLAMGMFISTFSTYRAVSKYLTLKLDELY